MEHDSLRQKSDMSAQELSMLSSELDKRKKSKTAMWLLWLFTGSVGGHRYYLGDTGRGIAHTIVFFAALIIGSSVTARATTFEDVVYGQFTMILLLGIPALWALIDGFFIGRRLAQKNTEVEAGIIDRIKSMRDAGS